MRKNKETIILAKIRALIRSKVRYYNLKDEGAEFYSNENYKTAKRIRRKKGSIIGNYPYYSKSTRAIEDLAKEIYKLMFKEIYKLMFKGES